MKGARLVLLVVVLFSGCHRKTRAEQLAAIESAYQSGILTKEEYDSKRAVVEPPPAPAPAPVKPPPEPPAPPPVPVRVPAPAPEPKPVTAVVTKSPPPEPEPEKEEPAPAPSAGCEQVEAKSGKGVQERFFPMPVARVKTAAEAALEKLDFNIRKDGGNEIEASKKRHIGVVIGAGGEKVFLRFEKAQGGTRVIAETKKSFVGRAAQKSWTNAVLAQTGCELRR